MTQENPLWEDADFYLAKQMKKVLPEAVKAFKKARKHKRFSPFRKVTTTLLIHSLSSHIVHGADPLNQGEE
jgi:hypothetical protein